MAIFVKRLANLLYACPFVHHKERRATAELTVNIFKLAPFADHLHDNEGVDLGLFFCLLQD